MNRSVRTLAGVLVTTVALSVSALSAQAGDDWEIDFHTIEGGGTVEAAGGQWEIRGTLGQFDATGAAELTSGAWQLTGGFWGLGAETLDRIFRDRFEPVPITFSTHLAPTFRNARCTTCHAVAATDFRLVSDDPPGVLPAGHAQVDASTDCTGCHSGALLPDEGTIDPGWQSAPATFDFRDKSDTELCAMAGQPVSGHTPLEHMSQDKLVLWAVGDGRLPFANSVPTAPPHDIEQWRELVQQWVSAGMPCQ